MFIVYLLTNVVDERRIPPVSANDADFSKTMADETVQDVLEQVFCGLRPKGNRARETHVMGGIAKRDEGTDDHFDPFSGELNGSPFGYFHCLDAIRL
jgi:hypothetical protein